MTVYICLTVNAMMMSIRHVLEWCLSIVPTAKLPSNCVMFVLHDPNGSGPIFGQTHHTPCSEIQRGHLFVIM